MIPLYHFIASLVLAAILYPFYGVNVLFIFVGGFLIDLDHYLWYIYKNKGFNPINAYKFYLKMLKEKSFNQKRKYLLLFHSAEFLVLMVIFAFYSKIMFIILIGLLYHYALDTITILFISKGRCSTYSIVWWLVKYRIKAS